MPLSWIIIILLVLLLVGVMPHWPYNAGWARPGWPGYYPSGLLGLILIIVLILLLLGRL
jgi:hypothetical protein